MVELNQGRFYDVGAFMKRVDTRIAAADEMIKLGDKEPNEAIALELYKAALDLNPALAMSLVKVKDPVVNIKSNTDPV